MSGDVTAAARVGSISSMSEPPLFRGVVTESLSAGVLHLHRRATKVKLVAAALTALLKDIDP